MKGLIASIITLMTVLIIGGGGYLIFANYEIKKEIANNQIKIVRMGIENDRLKKIIASKDDQIRSHQQNIRNLNNERNIKNSNNTKNSKPKNIAQKKETQHIYSNDHNKITTNNITNNKKHIVENKKHQKFSRNIKLVSDSRITILDNNKLESNMAIRGRYYPTNVIKMINNIQCDNNEKLYGIRNECSMRISNNFDLVYLGKMESRNIKNVDYTNHMIECHYSKKHGIMHDCKAKLKS